MENATEKSLRLLRRLPRVSLGNIRDVPDISIKERVKAAHRHRGQHGIRNRGPKHGQVVQNTLPRLGFETHVGTHFYLTPPKEKFYNKYHYTRKQYPPLTLLTLQRMIDLGRLDTTQPIDLTSLCRTRLIKVQPDFFHYGVNLTDEGADKFGSRIHIEVQKISNELVLAAIERNGGTIVTRYFDPICVKALVEPETLFKRGKPIPKCRLPEEDQYKYYSNPNNRGYLADPDQVKKAQYELSQKYGYVLPELDPSDPLFDMMNMRKKVRQIFYGLEPGWFVNLADKKVLTPLDSELRDYYETS